MNFPMPTIGLAQADRLTRAVLDECCAFMSAVREIREQGGDTTRFDKLVKKTSDEYEAWVNWSRVTWPSEPSNFMIADEPERYGAAIPFKRGDLWEHDGTRWNINRNGKIVEAGESREPRNRSSK